MNDNKTVPSAKEILQDILYGGASDGLFNAIIEQTFTEQQFNLLLHSMHEHTRLHLEAMLKEITSGDEKVLLKRDIEKSGNNYINNNIK